MLKRIFTNSILYAVGPQLPRIANILVLPLVTRFLTSTDYGIYGLITAYTGLLGALSDLGLAIVMVNAYYRYPARWPIIWKQLHGYLIMWSLLFAFLQGILLYAVIPHEADNNKWTIIILNAIQVAFLNTTIVFGSRYYQVAMKPLFMATTTAVVGTLSVVANYILIAVFKMGYMGWFWSAFISALFLFLTYIYPVYFKYNLRPIFSFRKRFLFRHLSVALPTIPHEYSAYLVNTSDRIVFNIVNVKLTSQGEYNLAYTFGNYFEFFGNAAGMAIAPFYTKLYSNRNHKSDKDARDLTFFFQLLFIFLGFIICLWSREILKVLIKNGELQKAYPIAIVIIMGYTYRPMYWACNVRLSFYEKTSQLWKISFIAGILNLAFNLVFVPLYGVKAAAVTTFFALLYMGFSGFFLKAYQQSNPLNYYPVFWLTLIIVTSIVVFLMKDLPVGYKMIVTAVMTIAAFFTCLKFKKQLKMLGA
jgi:O-antigen/teichoic acid export membrane protein